MITTDEAVAAERDPHARAMLLHEGQYRIAHHEAAFPTRQWYPHGIPGPFQTSAWARALSVTSEHYTTEAEIADTVKIRAIRTSLMRVGRIQRRFVLTRAGLRTRPLGLTDTDAAAQHEQLLELSGLDHIHVRLAPDQARHDHPDPFLLRDGAVYSEGPNGLYTPAGSVASYEGVFERLWEDAQPFTAQALEPC